MGAINVDYSSDHQYFLIDLLVPELRQEVSQIPKIEYWFGEKQQHARYGLPISQMPHMIEFLEKYKDYVEVSDSAISHFPDPTRFRPDAKVVLKNRIELLEQELATRKGKESETGTESQEPTQPQERETRRGPGRPRGS